MVANSNIHHNVADYGAVAAFFTYSKTDIEFLSNNVSSNYAKSGGGVFFNAFADIQMTDTSSYTNNSAVSYFAKLR